MTDTPRLALPLLDAAQAQKHVTVNEALLRLDALSPLVIETVTLAAPPAGPAEGAVHAVPAGATGAWAGQGGSLALYIGGGWVFAPLAAGRIAWLAERGGAAVWDGAAWQALPLAVSPAGAAMQPFVAEVDHTVASGASSTVTAAIPAQSSVFAVTGRVIDTITGTAASFRLGVSGSDDRYGSGLGLASGSWLRGLTGQPVTYYADTDLLLTAEGGDFAGGTVRLCVHGFSFGLPAV